jgi:hypothetical protein
LPDGPLADPGVRYSRTGLVQRARTQKGWEDHDSERWGWLWYGLSTMRGTGSARVRHIASKFVQL